MSQQRSARLGWLASRPSSGGARATRACWALLTVLGSMQTAACSSPAEPGRCLGRTVVAPTRGSCRVPGLPDGWSAAPLFGPRTPALAAWTGPRPAALARWCAFEHAAPTRSDHVALTAALRDFPDIDAETASADCPSGAGQGSGYNAEQSALLHEALRAGVGLPVPASVPGSGVRLVVLDTASARTTEVADLDPARAHGLTLTHLARDLACGGRRDCPVSVENAIAMPRHEGQVDWIHGGSTGSAVDLARGLVGVVGPWANETPRRPLVINLSLGWAEERGAHAPSAALEDALRFAACSGAIVVSASGNVRGGRGRGPLSPARHARTPAPSAETCLELGFEAAMTETGRPLLWAVGGVDDRDRPIATSRPHSTPGLVAYAELATVPAPGGYTMALTGTSIASAATAAIAARVWAVDPSASAAQVMDALHRSAYPVGRSADVSLRPSEVRRVDGCAAVATMCRDRDIVGCMDLSCTSSPPPPEGHLAAFRAAFAEHVAGERRRRVGAATRHPSGHRASGQRVGGRHR